MVDFLFPKSLKMSYNYNSFVFSLQYQQSKRELPNSLLKKYTKILESGELSDMEILIGEEPDTKAFHLHSFVLKVHSMQFYTALTKNRVKAENDIIEYRKISVKVFEILIK
jgi:hypothetical protein